MANTNNEFTQTCNVITQRNQIIELQPPPIRYNPVSPYPNYTQAQLDMRRKAEILQYNKNSTQTGKITKSQKWSRLVNGPFQRKTYTTVSRDASGNILDRTVYNTVPCSEDKYLPTLSSSCDVPGPIVTLQYNPNIPLYNYADGENVFGIINEEKLNNFNSYTSDNILSLNGNNTALFTLAIFNTEERFTTFEFNTPIGFYISGEVSNSSNNDASGIFQIPSINIENINVYNNNNVVNMIKNPLITQSFSSRQVNFYTDFQRDNNNNIINKTFYGAQYLGNLKVSGIMLSTQPGLLYNIKIALDINVLDLEGIFSNINLGFFMNLTPNNVPYSATRCNFVPQTNVEPRVGFYLKEI
jgi:hypothetical protein